MTINEAEIALAYHFNFRNNLIVPNVSRGLNLHECDLLILTPAGYAYEIEIKLTRADLLADKKKSHNHKSKRIKYLWFAVPETLEGDIEHVPERAGIILLERRWDNLCCRIVRRPKPNGSYKWNDSERAKLAHLGAMRIWRLKKKL